MSPQGPVAAMLQDGARLHLQHGPIDLIIQAESAAPTGRDLAYAGAARCFDTLLQGLVDELDDLRAAMTPHSRLPVGPVALRMHRAALPHCGAHFVTRMIAVAGAVADEVLDAMRAAAPLTRAFVNNGGDIALHLAPGQSYTAAISGLDGAGLGRIALTSGDGIGGMATSGTGGRSHSLGIADSVTVLAATAAQADAAATLIANAVDLPDHRGILRVPAEDLQPDSDLGRRLVVTQVPRLGATDRRAALAAGLGRAAQMLSRAEIRGAALFLQGEHALLGAGFETTQITGPSARVGKGCHA